MVMHGIMRLLLMTGITSSIDIHVAMDDNLV